MLFLKTRKGQSQKYFKILGKNTIFNEHPVYDLNRAFFTEDGTLINTKFINNKVNKMASMKNTYTQKIFTGNIFGKLVNCIYNNKNKN